MRELPEETLYDTRLIARHIEEGLISEEDVKKRLEALEDCEPNMDVVDIQGLAEPAAPVAPAAPAAPAPGFPTA